jgi:serine/threonine protein phosphatase PrpC
MEVPQLFTFSLEQSLLCLVADGLGGHAAGEVASYYAIQRLNEEIDGTDSDALTLIASLRQINLDLYQMMEDKPHQYGMGTTIAGLLVKPDQLLIFNVGDSRVYHYADDTLTQLSIDDTPEALYYGDTYVPVRSHVVTQCLGGIEPDLSVQPHHLRMPVDGDSIYLLCSDGVTDMLSPDEVAASISRDLEKTVRTLFGNAMAAGGDDNISIVLVSIDADP